MKVFQWDEVNGRSEEDRMHAFFGADSDCYAIFQLKHNEETAPMQFVSYADLQRRGEQPEHDHYELIYTAPLKPYKDQNVLLEELYEKFNVDHPSDFTGHSLSVSDIVAIRSGQEVSFHYVDSMGFVSLPEFMKPENYLKYTEMSMEDDYGMIDGMINNGKSREEKQPVEPPQKKESILEQLRSASDPSITPKQWKTERDLE